MGSRSSQHMIITGYLVDHLLLKLGLNYLMSLVSKPENYKWPFVSDFPIELT